jgi:hypothetical protein
VRRFFGRTAARPCHRYHHNGHYAADAQFGRYAERDQHRCCGGSHNPAVSIIGGATASFLTNSGTIQSTGSGAARTIRFVTSTTANVTITNNAGAFIQGPGDVIQSNININSGTISIINAGTIRSTGVGGSNGQAIDLDNIQAGTATANITNLATGVISAADSDASPRRASTTRSRRRRWSISACRMFATAGSPSTRRALATPWRC